MENLTIIFSVIFDNYIIGMAIGIVILLLVKLVSFICCYVDKPNKLIILIRLGFIDLAVNKMNKLGIQALVYSPLIDGRKVTAKDELKNQELKFNDPLNIEQDHNLRNYIYNKDLNIIFYKSDDLSVKGYFHDISSKKVYTGAFIGDEKQ